MSIAAFVHAVIIVVVCIHMFTLGTIESENIYCYITWPLSHLYYAFLNYMFIWFFGYNACEITGRWGNNILATSRKFLWVLILFSPTPLLLKLIVRHFCWNWTLSLNSCLHQVIHVFIETLLAYIYFGWFEKKYAGYRIFYKESIF